VSGAAVRAQVDQVTAEEFPKVVQRLVDILGGPNVAYLGGVTRTSALAEWIRGERAPKSEDRENRLRLALQLSLIIKERFSDKSVRAWFWGANRRFEDNAPIAILGTQSLIKVQSALIGAANEFVSL
jgi:hypothetical protein